MKETFYAKIFRAGNSDVVTIPYEFVRVHDLGKGMTIKVTIEDV